MAINKAPFRFCQVVNEANGKVPDPDDSRRLQQGWVKIQDSSPDKPAKYVNVWD